MTILQNFEKESKQHNKSKIEFENFDELADDVVVVIGVVARRL